MRFLPQTQVLKDLSNDVPLVNEANDSHFAGALRKDKRICFVHLTDFSCGSSGPSIKSRLTESAVIVK